MNDTKWLRQGTHLRGLPVRLTCCISAEPILVVVVVISGRFIPLLSKHKTLYDICTMLDQPFRRWNGIVQMLYKGFVFAGIVQYAITK